MEKVRSTIVVGDTGFQSQSSQQFSIATQWGFDP